MLRPFWLMTFLLTLTLGCNLTSQTETEVITTPEPPTPTVMLATETCRVRVQIGEPMNAYAAPTEQSSVVGQVTNNQETAALKQRDGFVQVEVSEGVTGWIGRGVVAPLDETSLCLNELPVESLPPTDQCLVVNTNFEAIGIFSQANDTNSFIARMQTGLSLPILSSQTDWYEIDLVFEKTGLTGSGWVEANKVSLEGNCTDYLP